MNLVGSSISEGFQKVFSQVSPSTAIALVAGIGLGAAITYAARGFFSEREIAVLPTESETIEELRSQLVEAQNELLKKTLDSVDPNPDLLDEIASLQDQLSLKNGNAARLMGEYEEELQALKIRLASQKTEVAVHSTLPSTDAGVEHRIAQLQASQRKLQEKLNAVQALSDRNAREAFSAEESAKELSLALERRNEEIQGLQSEIAARAEETRSLGLQLTEQKEENGQQAKEIQTLQETLQRKQEEIDVLPAAIEEAHREFSEELEEWEKAFFKEVYKGLGLPAPNLSDRKAAIEDLKCHIGLNQKSHRKETQRWIAAIEAISTLQEKLEESRER